MTSSLRDDSAIAYNPAALRDRLHRTGYVFLPGLLDRQAGVRLRDEVLARLAAHDWLAPGSDPSDARPGAPRVEGEDEWFRGYTSVQASYAFHATAHHARLLGVMRTLLGETVVHPRKVLRVTYPGREYPTPPHQDLPLFQGSSRTLTAWVPLGDIGSAHGALRVLEGSHRSLRQAFPAEGVGHIGVDANPHDAAWRTTDYRMGDVLVFSCLLVHWAPPNRADSLRVSVDYRYQPASDPICDLSLLPHLHPRVPGWDVLTADWPNCKPIDVPPGLDIAAMQDPFALAGGA